MGGLVDFQRTILGMCVDQNKADNSPILTGERNLDITKAELLERIRKNKDGEGYIDALQGESAILARQGLFVGRYDYDKNDYYFKVPDWDAFISAVKSFYDVCYAPGCHDIEEE